MSVPHSNSTHTMDKPIPEAERTRWVGSYLPVPEVVDTGSDRHIDWLLTTAIAGLDATRHPLFNDPGTLVPALARGLAAFHAATPVTCQVWGEVVVQLGPHEESRIRALAVGSKKDAGFYGFKLAEPDLTWRKFVAALEAGTTQDDMDNATRFLPD